MEVGGWSLDQLMELAGLSVAQAGKLQQAQITPINVLMYEQLVWKVHPPSAGKNILVVCGPGNNGKPTSMQTQSPISNP